jgi:hypothetical protein
MPAPALVKRRECPDGFVTCSSPMRLQPEAKNGNARFERALRSRVWSVVLTARAARRSMQVAEYPSG